MSWLHSWSYRKVFASLLVLFFFGSQAFSCCLVNRQMGEHLKSSLAALFPGKAIATHACCPSKEKPTAPQGSHGRSESGCCIQDANAKLPQIASEGIIPPGFSTPVLERLAALAGSLPDRSFAKVLPQNFSDPPRLYLTHLQLLI